MKCRWLLLSSLLSLTACSPSTKEMYDQANKFFAQENYAEARPLYEELLVRDANNSNIYAKLAMIYAAQKEWGRCTQAAQQALDNKLDLYDVYYHGAFCHARLNQNKEAMALLTEALKKFPDRQDLKMEAAYLYFQEKRLPEASQLYKDLSDREPKNSEYAYNAGSTLEALKDYDESERYYRRVLETQPNHANASYGLGSVFEKRGEVDIAVGYYERALKNNSAHLSALLNLAQLQEKSQPKVALATWKKYLELARQKNQSQNFIKQAEQRIKALGGG